jgi:hypothetical protein
MIFQEGFWVDVFWGNSWELLLVIICVLLGSEESGGFT